MEIYHKATTNKSSLVAVPIHGTAEVEFCLDPLQYAVSLGFPDIADLLLGQPGVDVNALSSGSHVYTALQLACKNRYPEVVKILLQAGARTDATITYSTIRLAEESQSQEILEMILEAAERERAADGQPEESGSGEQQFESQEHSQDPNNMDNVDLLLCAGYFVPPTNGLLGLSPMAALVSHQDWRMSNLRGDMRS